MTYGPYRNPPIPMGANDTSMGSSYRVSAVGSLGGERYYWLTDSEGDVIMVPAEALEKDYPAPQD